MAAVKRVKLREPQTNFAPYVVNLPKTMTVRIVGVNIVTGAPEHKKNGVEKPVFRVLWA